MKRTQNRRTLSLLRVSLSERDKVQYTKLFKSLLYTRTPQLYKENLTHPNNLTQLTTTF